MKVIAIVAMSTNKVIGKNGALPWWLAEDMKRFRAHTLGNAVIMGRKTFESMGCRPLGGRLNIIVSKTIQFGKDYLCASSIKDAIHFATLKDCHKVFIIGGAQIYRDAIPYCDELLLTVVEGIIEGDTYFDADISGMELVSSEHFAKDNRNEFNTVFQRWSRI